MSTFTDNVATRCLAEQAAFQSGKAKEWWDPQYKRIGVYWGKLGITRDGREGIIFEKNANGSLKVDADGQPIPVNKKNKNPPWSAAFISFVAREAGAGSDFHYRAYHSFYIMAALRAAAAAGSPAKWIAQRRESYTPKVGDLIACGRESAKTATFDTAKNFIDTSDPHSPDFFPSHSDFVIAVESSKAVTMGGNVGNSVGLKNWVFAPGKRIGDHDPRSPSASVICIMECKL